MSEELLFNELSPKERAQQVKGGKSLMKKKKNTPEKRESQIRLRFYLPSEEHKQLKALKKRYKLNYSKLITLLLVKQLKSQGEDLF